jgi:hypothetical protein
LPFRQRFEPSYSSQQDREVPVQTHQVREAVGPETGLTELDDFNSDQITLDKVVWSRLDVVAAS